MSPRKLSFTLLATAAALASLDASAVTRCVNPGGTGGCFSSIAAAIAASAPGGDSIVVAAGTYFESNIQLNRSVDISGAGVDLTIVDGGNGPFPVFKYPDFAFPVTATLSHVTVQHGYRGLNIGGGNNVTLDYVRVTGNGPGTGAGIFNGSSNLHLNHSTVDGNSSSDSFFGCDWSGGSGAGIASLCGGGSNYISNSTITGNTAATWGGGLIVNDGTTIIENSTISGNHANHPDPFLGGGALFVGGAFPDVTVRFTTIADNTATGTGGGLWGGSLIKVYATILQDNAGGDCATAPFFATPVTSLGYNIASDATCALAQPTDLNSTNAIAGPLADNGGPTETQAPSAFSPAIDRIPVAGCSVPADQRGVARPQGGACDVGAVEVTASEQLESLEDLVTGVGPGGSLAAKVAGALAALEAGHIAAACGKLGALLNEVRAQAGKKIPASEADAIIAAVQRLRGMLGC